MVRNPCVWSSYRPFPPLSEDDVHVARLWIDDVIPLRSQLEPLLTPDELHRAEAFRFERDRERFILVRADLRVIAARYLGKPPTALRIRQNQFGKPVLADGGPGERLEFNVSHAGSLAVMVFSRGRGVGVDVEQIRHDVPPTDIAARVFSFDERRVMESLSGDERLRYFFRTWVRKEAYVKGRGRGFTIPPERFTVAGGDGAVLVDDSEVNSRPGHWSVVDIDVAIGFAGAVAIEGHDSLMRCFEAVDALAPGGGR
jgi:4'-phosphopantetheinyl transferase